MSAACSACGGRDQDCASCLGLVPAGLALLEARAALHEALEYAKATAVGLVAAGVSEVEAARRCGITRPTLRAALGK